MLIHSKLNKKKSSADFITVCHITVNTYSELHLCGVVYVFLCKINKCNK